MQSRPNSALPIGTITLPSAKTLFGTSLASIKIEAPILFRRHMMATEIRNKENILGTEKNSDGSAIQEVVTDDKVVAEITNKENILGTETNDDGSPIKEVTPKDE